jgi:hypothetical protein
VRIEQRQDGSYIGVSWHKGHQKWMARIKVNGRSHFLGYFDTAQEAGIAYSVARNVRRPTPVFVSPLGGVSA